jgi:hypothetical protein
MNSLIEKFEQQFLTRRGKKYTDKPSNRRKERKTKNYRKQKSEKERRKQGKTRYDTFRRDEQPTEEENSNLSKEVPVTAKTIAQTDPSEEEQDEDWIYDGRAVYTYDLEYIEELRMLTSVRGWIVKRSHEEEIEAPRKRARIEQ